MYFIILVDQSANDVPAPRIEINFCLSDYCLQPQSYSKSYKHFAPFRFSVSFPNIFYSIQLIFICPWTPMGRCTFLWFDIGRSGITLFYYFIDIVISLKPMTSCGGVQWVVGYLGASKNSFIFFVFSKEGNATMVTENQSFHKRKN